MVTKAPRRMEQAIFKTIVQMAYEMDACDIIERMLQHMEEDFNTVKYWKSQEQWMTTSPYCDKNEHIPTHIYTIFIIAPDLTCKPMDHCLLMDYHNDPKQTVDVWHLEDDEYTDVIEFQTIKPVLHMILNMFRVGWQNINRRQPISITTRQPHHIVSIMGYLELM